MYGVRNASLALRIILAGAGSLWVALIWWMLFGHGLEAVGGWFGRTWPEGDVFRRLSMAVALSIYYVRLLFIWFVFLKRGISRQEAFAVAAWLFCIYMFFSICSGRNANACGLWTGIGIGAFLVGSWLNTRAEHERYLWKRCGAHCGELYTQGLFRFTRHPTILAMSSPTRGCA